MWEEKIQNIFLIKTGDGEYYTPMYINPQKEINYNVEGFDFVGVEGTFVARELVQGSQYPIELYFIDKLGKDHIEISKDFEISARNSNSWEVQHPIYGLIICQPLSLKFETFPNITKVTGTLWETIKDVQPTKTYNVAGDVEQKKVAFYESTELISLKLPASSILKASRLASMFDSYYRKLFATIEQANNLKNLVREVSAASQELVNSPIPFIKALQSLIDFPIQVTANTTTKVYELRNALLDLISDIDLLLFETEASSILYSAFDMAVSGTYDKRKDVGVVVSVLTEMYDKIQEVYETNEIQLNPENAFILDTLYWSVIANLYNIALGTKQERSVVLEEDSNVVQLSHRFYGLSEDATDRFLSENSLSLKELFIVRKGKTLYWYV